MNELRFDHLARLIGGRSSRRTVLKGMSGAAAIALGLATAAAPARAAMCVGDGGWCTSDGDCCSGSCVSNYCAAAPASTGGGSSGDSSGGDTGMTSGATSGGSTTTSAPVAVSSMPNTGVGQPGESPDWLAPAAIAGLAATAAFAAGRARRRDVEDESA